MANQFGDADIPDRKMKVWLEERIVRLELYRYELDSIGEQIEALDQHADYLQGKGQPVPLLEQQQRETLEGAYLSKQEELRAAFEPTASHPFSPQEEMKLYCQTLMEVNERLAHHNAPAERKFPSGQPEQPGRALEQQRVERYLDMAQDMKSYREYSVEMQRIDAQMQTHGKATKIRWKLQNEFDAYRVAQETYLKKMLAKYQVGDLAAIQDEMKATEPLIEQAYQQQAHHSSSVKTSIERAYAAMQEEQSQRQAENRPQEKPHKKPLRDLYGTDEEQPRQEPDQDRTREM